MIIPSIDLMDGKAVQLRQGREKVLERSNVMQFAREFSRYGEIAVIDLDAALGKGNNSGLIKEICKIADCRVGGGIRSQDKAEEILKYGAKKIIIGTKASPEFLKKLPAGKVIVAIDSKDDNVVTEGWTKKTKKTPFEAIKELERYCSGFLFTNVNKEGMMEGLDFGIIEKIRKATKKNLTVAGGITTIDDITQLEDLGCDSQIGMALYTGRIELGKAFVSLINFKKSNGLVPTIVQEENGQVMMLAYSNPKSLLMALESGKGTYYSRSRKKIWVKGETSGNFQVLKKARYDCDRDVLLFTVSQKNFACHTGKYSCFGERDFSMEELYSVIAGRIKNPRRGSYTSLIAKDEELVKAKIKEEAMEVINYKDKDNLVWEIADLAYFILVLMAKKGITLDDIKNELGGRRK
ncbi:bifunctional phosphoribosyl-AMP cyclohydrolase/phosphoribosyl-ATP diphosphatase HisIE [Candidatus Woesearchaeota archaeon]|nr:bifunctional phosphoribosyl-AMP cyclohydrolase/phosphoribosyl-ATP diphosphatase HisIE [Candidatus Woesearchaeota archaeon]